MDLTAGCADVISEVNAVEFEMVSCCNMPSSKLYTLTRDQPLLQDAIKVVTEVAYLLWQIPQRETVDK